MKKRNYTLHHTTNPALSKMREHTVPYKIKIFNNDTLIIYPNVMSPKYDWAGIFLVEHMPKVKEKTVCEVGCGTGIFSIYAKKFGAKKVVALDINPFAVENTKENFKLHSLEAKVLQSDVFNALEINERFDWIVFNLPYHGTKAKDDLEKAVSDEGYKTLKNFFQNVRDFLEPSGKVIVGFSESGDKDILYEQIKNNSFNIDNIVEDFRENYQAELYFLSQI